MSRKRIGLVPESELKYGILVMTDNQFQWVTSVENKVAIWAKGQTAYLSSNREEMERICLGLAVHGTPAVTVIIPNYLTDLKNPKEDTNESSN